MKEQDVIKKLRAHIYVESGNAAKFAEENGFTPAYVSGVLNGKKPLSDRMLAIIGMKKVASVEYVKQ